MTKYKIETSIIINSEAEKVWEVLMDHSKYPDWNPFIIEISGEAEPGKTIKAKIQPDGKSPMTFKPKVLIRNNNKEFRWKGKLFIKGLFDGEHYFILEKRENNTTEFIHGENFSGLFAGSLLKSIGENTKNGFKAMNKALKERVEKNTPT